MSYKVLARKWRPKTFDQLVGQEHVLRALINALDNDRLHHAYLFTGTRGVGKTTIARILAKCLNCELGVTSKPCDKCQSCLEVDSGRFIDLIEVDAASRTKVEDTRELLDNVQYAPTRGRYKVYLIDEVHMLSGHSFNALLKTLEEPPPHVKFLLATTDPQKLPVTVLSRCLQFNLKAMSAERIVGHLKTVLDTEAVAYSEAALWALGRAADGSMRDAMSLTDQAIAFGAGELKEAEVRDMLGVVDRDYVYRLLMALAAGDPASLLQEVEQIAEQSPDFSDLLAELITVLHRIAITQVAPEAIDDSQGDKSQLLTLSASLSPENVQLYYQIALLGRKDQAHVPDPRSGLEMTLLRMLTFKPEDRAGSGRLGEGRKGREASAKTNPPAKNSSVTNSKSASDKSSELQQQGISHRLDAAFLNKPNAASSQINARAAMAQKETVRQEPVARQLSSRTEARAQSSAGKYMETPAAEVYESWAVQENRPETNIVEFPNYEHRGQEPSKTPASTLHSNKRDEDDVGSRQLIAEKASEKDVFWDDIVSKLDLKGASLNLAKNCVLANHDGPAFELLLSSHHEPLLIDQHKESLEQAIRDYLGSPVKLQITLQASRSGQSGMSPDVLESKRKCEALQTAEENLRNDPVVQALIKDFDASLNQDSIQSLK